MKEEWKDVIGYEDFYKVSNTGKVFSKRQNKIMKPQPNSNGYLRIYLSDENGKKYFFIHRLVALHFVLNPDIDTNNVVNHLDSNYLNNNADNLEWTTMKGNSQHALKSGRMKRTPIWLERMHKSLQPTYKAVIGYDPVTGEIKERFDAIQHVRTKGYEPSCVCVCCKGKMQTHKGLKWRYADDIETLTPAEIAAMNAAWGGQNECTDSV